MSAEVAGDLEAAGWRQLVAVRDPDVAERWRASLRASGIEAEVRIADVQEAMPGTSMLPGYLPATDPWAYVLHVPAASREEAARLLIDAGWDGRHGERAPEGASMPLGTALRGALVALAAAAVVVVLQAARG